MALIKFDPYRGFEGLGRRMSKLMEDAEKGFTIEGGGFAPRVDITEDDKNIFVHAELPGLKKEEVKLSLNEDRMLTLSGEKKKEELKEGQGWVRNEISYGSFSRSFILPDNTDIDSVNAKFDNGVLEVTIGKKEPEKPKEINVEIQ